MSELVTIHPDRKTSRLTRWVARSPVRALVVFAVGYALWQPAVACLTQAMFGHVSGFASVVVWPRFEVCMATLGALAGCAWFYSLRWRPGTWLSDWAELSVPVVAWSATLSTLSDPQVFAATKGWSISALYVALTLVAAGIIGAGGACLTRWTQRFVRAATPPAHASARTKSVP